MNSLNDPGALAELPLSLKQSLLEEYKKTLQNYLERRWQPAELSAAIFCEIVYCIVKHYPTNDYLVYATKPPNFAKACQDLEQQARGREVPRSFRLLIPKILPALYEIRNQRGVGHVSGD